MITKIILSCNEDPMYSSFWPEVAKAYDRILPDAEVHLALLSNDEELAKEFSKYGAVTRFNILPGIPEFAQAKMSRFILASQLQEEVCYVDDIDIFPLSRNFITAKTDKRPLNHLLCVGGEVYNHNGCYPVSQMTAEGHVWKQFINPNNLPLTDLYASWLGETMFDRRENMLIELNWDKDDYFSDERLLRRLLYNNPVPKYEMERGYKNFMEATIDRYDWKVYQQKLNNHGYVNAHGIRPFDKEKYAPLIQYIEKTY